MDLVAHRETFMRDKLELRHRRDCLRAACGSKREAKAKVAEWYAAADMVLCKSYDVPRLTALADLKELEAQSQETATARDKKLALAKDQRATSERLAGELPGCQAELMRIEDELAALGLMGEVAHG